MSETRDNFMVVSEAKYQELLDLVEEVRYIAEGRHNTYRDESNFQLRGILKTINRLYKNG